MVSILFSDIHSIPHVVPAGSWARLGAKGVMSKCCQGPTMCKVIPGAVVGTDKSEMEVPPTQRLGLEPGRKNQKTPERHGDQQRLLGAVCVSRTRRGEPRELGRASRQWPESRRHKREGMAFQAEVTVWAQVQRQESLSAATWQPPLKAERGGQEGQVHVQMARRSRKQN